MLVHFKSSTPPHIWIAIFWCVLTALIFGTIAVISCWIRKCSRTLYRKKRKKHIRRAQSAAEFDPKVLTAANKRNIFKGGRSASSEQDNNSETEHSEKAPLVSAKLETFAKLLFSKSLTQDSTCSSSSVTVTGNGVTSTKETISPIRHTLNYQYSALDTGLTASDRQPRERLVRERALTACQEWLKSTNGRYEINAHLDDIGSRNNKNWFLLNDSSVRTERLMTILPIPNDCVALEELPPSECPKGILMELLGSLQHPYIYPVLDLEFLYKNAMHYACLVMPFNARGSLKDLIYKSQWNESWNRKYTRKSTCLPLSQVQRLGRQILEALLFLRERGFPSHGHLHSGNVILQNGVARLSGLENGLLGLNSRIIAVMWSRNVTDIENMDIICFGHLLFEMCVGYELNAPQPTAEHYEFDLDRYPQVTEVLQMIFESPDGRFPTVEELVLCDLFRNIDLREMRGPCISSFKHGLSNSTLNLLNAVRRRQGASLSGSYSEGSSPCTPPSTPRDRRTCSREMDSLDLSSDSDAVLDEIVITPSSFEFPNPYDLQNSPIHVCNNSVQSADELQHQNDRSPSSSSISRHHNYHHNRLAPSIEGANNYQDQIPETSAQYQHSSNQLTTDSFCASMQPTNKNSKSRRMEYSMKGMKLGVSNPSQDSAFGSMTDGELSIASSSMRMSSFQSMSSPIDEGVEDVNVASDVSDGAVQKLEANSISTLCGNTETATIGHSKSDSVSLNKTKNPSDSHSHHNLTFDPPTILVNDQNSFYTTSPSKAFGTMEVFSQKYRVSSFEDMSARRSALRNVNKLTFRSLEEERRIDSAFQPCHPHSSVTIDSSHLPSTSNDSASKNRITGRFTAGPNSEKFKKLTHAAFSRKISGCGHGGAIKDRHYTWKNSILTRKSGRNLIRSNESLLDHHITKSMPFHDGADLKKRVNSTSEISTNLYEPDSTMPRMNPRKSRSERHLFSLSKIKQTAIADYDEEDEYEQSVDYTLEESTFELIRPATVMSSVSFGTIEQSGSLNNFIDNSSCSSIEDESSNSSHSSPSHRDVCQKIGGYERDPDSTEEKIPLLDGMMEMSPISPTETDELL